MRKHTINHLNHIGRKISHNCKLNKHDSGALAGHYHAVALGKLLTPVCLCHQAA